MKFSLTDFSFKWSLLIFIHQYLPTVCIAVSLSSFGSDENGARELIFEEHFNKLLKSWKMSKVLKDLNERQVPLLGEDLKGLYRTLKNHPALMDRRLKVGGRIPPSAPPTLDGRLTTVEKRTNFNLGIAQPACPFKTEWVLLSQALDMNDTEVEIFQPNDDSNRYQWFYTVSCDFDVLLEEESETCPYCCRGINHHRFSSQCVPRRSYVMALIRRPTVSTFDWDYIQVNTSCNCAINPRGN